jgi:hypothetical protein
MCSSLENISFVLDYQQVVIGKLNIILTYWCVDYGKYAIIG